MQNGGKIIHLEWNKCRNILRYFDVSDTLVAFLFVFFSCVLLKKQFGIALKIYLVKGLTFISRTFGKF